MVPAFKGEEGERRETKPQRGSSEQDLNKNKVYDQHLKGKSFRYFIIILILLLFQLYAVVIRYTYAYSRVPLCYPYYRYIRYMYTVLLLP